MVSRRKTKAHFIEMPKKLLNAWLRYLNDPKTKRGRATLLDERGGMCCLGVLQMAAAGGKKSGIERAPESQWDGAPPIMVPEALPSMEWLKAHKVVFFDRYGKKATVPYLPTLLVKGDDPSCAGWDASDANDEVKPFPSNRSLFSFREIAAAIKATAKGI